MAQYTTKPHQAQRAMAAITAQYCEDLTPETTALLEELVTLSQEQLGRLYRSAPRQVEHYAQQYAVPLDWVQQAITVAYEEVTKL